MFDYRRLFVSLSAGAFTKSPIWCFAKSYSLLLVIYFTVFISSCFFFPPSFPQIYNYIIIYLSPKLFPEFGHPDIFLQVTVIFHQTHVRQIHSVSTCFPQLIWFHQIYTRFIMIYILNKTHTQPLTTAIHQLLVNSFHFPKEFPP